MFLSGWYASWFVFGLYILKLAALALIFLGLSASILVLFRRLRNRFR